MSFVLFAYFGPESMLPMTSVVATVVGVFLMFGRNTTRFIRRALRERFGRTRPARSVPRPHFQIHSETRSPSETSQP